MASKIKEKISELKRFSSVLKNASDLYTSADELLKYCLPRCTLKQLIEDLWQSELETNEKSEIRETVLDISGRIAANTASAVVAFAKETDKQVDLKDNDSWDLYAKCSGNMLAKTLSNCLFLFHGIYDIRSIPGLFTLDQVDEYERIYQAATQLLSQIGPNGFNRELSSAVLDLYGQNAGHGNEKKNSVFAHKTFLYATQEVATDQKDAEEDGLVEFTEAAKKLIDKIASHDFDIFEMRELAKFNLKGKVSIDLFKKACNVLPTVQSIVDLRVIGLFLRVLKRIACSYGNWDALMLYFYEKFRHENGNLEDWKDFYQHFEEDLNKLISALEDHAYLHTDQKRMKEAVDEFAWLLMISPTSALVRILQHSLDSILMVPNVLRVLRRLPEYCNIELDAVLREDDTVKEKAPILMLALRHVLTSDRETLQSDTRRQNFAYMCVAFCRERRELVKGEKAKEGKAEDEKEDDEDLEVARVAYGDVVDFALVDGSMVLVHLVFPALKDVFYQEIVIEVARKLLTDLGARRTPILWKVEKGISLSVVDADGAKTQGVSVLQLISTLLNIVRENTDIDYPLIDSCYECLRALADRLKEDGIYIEKTTFEHLLENFDDSFWAFKYGFAFWFSGCLKSYKKKVPEVLFNALVLEKRETVEVIKLFPDDGNGSNRHVFRMVFELATVHPAVAVDMVKGFSTWKSNSGSHISRALVDVIRSHRAFPKHKIVSMVEVVQAIVNQVDSFRPTIPLLTEISESSFYGLRLVEPILLIHEAVTIAVNFERESGDTAAVPFSILQYENQVALKLLMVFCELAKEHMEKEMIDLRRSRLKKKVEIREPRPIPADVVINREIRVETELSQLYVAAVLLSHHIDGLPSYLQILLVQLAGYHVELGRMKIGPAYDEIIRKAFGITLFTGSADKKKKKHKSKVLSTDDSEPQVVSSDVDQQVSDNAKPRSSSSAETASYTVSEANKLAVKRRRNEKSDRIRDEDNGDPRNFSSVRNTKSGLKKRSYIPSTVGDDCNNDNGNDKGENKENVSTTLLSASSVGEQCNDNAIEESTREIQEKVVEAEVQEAAAREFKQDMKNVSASNPDQPSDPSLESKEIVSWDLTKSGKPEDDEGQFKKPHTRPKPFHVMHGKESSSRGWGRERSRTEEWHRVGHYKHREYNERERFGRRNRESDSSEASYYKRNQEKSWCGRSRGSWNLRPASGADEYFGDVDLESIQTSFRPVYEEYHPDPLETSRHNALFVASTRLINDKQTSAIVENHIRRSVNTAARPVGKPRRGALPPASEADREYDGRGRREGRHFENRNEGQGDGSDGRGGGGGVRRKNKNKSRRNV